MLGESVLKSGWSATTEVSAACEYLPADSAADHDGSGPLPVATAMGLTLDAVREIEALAGVIETVADDLYALGVTLYRLLEGDAAPASPAGGPDPTALSPHIHGSLRRALTKALQVDPAERFGSASDLRHALEKAQPVISWTPASEGHAWVGSSTDGSVNWRARLVSRSGGFDLEVERQLAGRGVRKDTAAGARARNLEEGLTFARKALEKIATGR